MRASALTTENQVVLNNLNARGKAVNVFFMVSCFRIISNLINIYHYSYFYFMFFMILLKY